LFQLVSLVRNGKPEKMGKRLGNLITLQEVVEEIDDAVGNPHAGRDALRLFYLARRSDTPIVLDVELAKRQEVENPVFYMQYGYARLCSILHRAKDKFGISLPRHSESLAKRVEHPLELDLLAQLGRYPALLEDAADAREPHRIVGFLEQIAQSFQRYYTQIGKESPILPRASDRAVEGWEQSWDWEKTRGRLLWVEAIRTVYASGLAILGLSAPERMVRAAGEDDGREASS
jgi:arginyl-tRNA synthetase